MVLFSPKSLPPVSLRHNGRWIRLQESQRPDWKPDWFSLLIQLSWCRDGFTRMYLSTGVCQQRQGAIKTRSDHFFFSFNCCISGKSCSLSCCETCKSAAAHTSTSSPAAAVVVFFFLLRFTWMLFFFSLSTSPLQSGLSAHTALHKLNCPLFKPWQVFSIWICLTRLHSSTEGGGGEAVIPETAVT